MSALIEARALLERVTPIHGDCGELCGSACCLADEDGQGGVHLFPGEESLYAGASWASIVPCELEGAPARLLVCPGRCERGLRPLGCRIFPLTPVKRGGIWRVRMDRRAWAMCPLMRSGAKGLNPAFVAAAEAAIQRIASEPEGEAFLLRWRALEARFHAAL